MQSEFELESEQDTGWSDVEEQLGIEIEPMSIINAGEGLLGGDVPASALDEMIPLILPRKMAPDCDLHLQNQLTMLLGETRMDKIMNPDGDTDVNELCFKLM